MEDREMKKILFAIVVSCFLFVPGCNLPEGAKETQGEVIDRMLQNTQATEPVTGLQEQIEPEEN